MASAPGSRIPPSLEGLEPRTTNRQNNSRKRASKACRRCRRQKIRCTGSIPCEPCTQRKLLCHFDEDAQKILITRGYIRGLERRLATFEQQGGEPVEQRGFPDSNLNQHTDLDIDNYEDESDNDEEHGGDDDDDDNEETNVPDPNQDDSQQADILNREASPRQPATNSHRSSPGPPLMNPLAHGFTSYFADSSGRPIYLGTSSNWSFGRRVLAMAHEKVVHTPLSPENLLFEGKSYDLGWNGVRQSPSVPQNDPPVLPSADYATYLISAVKFHCGQLYHLFEEEKFMQQFTTFQQDPTQKLQLSSLWYIHYLLILAFGKAFVAQSSKGSKPPGADLFVHAMELMPEFAFYNTDPIEAIQVLCCAALYLHCLDFRGAAYRKIGQALRMALEHGMHTEMPSQQVDPELAQRCRKVWWTVYILDRQMSSLMGLPMGIGDELISAELPAFPGQLERSTALSIQIQLSRVLAQILNTVYGPEGRLDKRFVTVTKESLKNVAKVTNQLNSSFGILENGSQTSISRLSAYLHLLYHQCIVLTTRPLLFTFLQSRLGHTNKNFAAMLKSSSVRKLLRMCVESAQQMLKILTALQENSLLVSFLPFDLDAAFTSGIALLMAAKIEGSFIKDPSPWLQRSYGIHDEIISRGNLVARMIKSELEQLEEILNRIAPAVEKQADRHIRAAEPPISSGLLEGQQQVQTSHIQEQFPAQSYPVHISPSTHMSDDITMDGFNWEEGLSAEQLSSFAESMDLSALDWLSAETDL